MDFDIDIDIEEKRLEYGTFNGSSMYENVLYFRDVMFLFLF